ncbi:hypothetical protein ENLAB_33280 (plasmid) [Enterococcus innesii]|uniref:Uncharacterized protein n=1 Tax=Enterococcus innesii TaxID=2839759 RepID=A0ABM7XX47_9ENTE|nr:hypothetical protein [Enterococcus innesii]BDG69764.1 hypothetical protein ENLAB_33280 [Enterococcus innesii]
MKKLLTFALATLGFILFSTATTASASTTNITEDPVISENSETFIDENLVGTKIDVPMTRTGGYLYKNISYTKSNAKKTYLGLVTKGASVSFGVTLAKGYVQVGVAYSEDRTYKEYKNTADIKATWGVYDKYSGNYMYSTTTSQKNVTWYSYTRAK